MDMGGYIGMSCLFHAFEFADGPCSSSCKAVLLHINLELADLGGTVPVLLYRFFYSPWSVSLCSDVVLSLNEISL